MDVPKFDLQIIKKQEIELINYEVHKHQIYFHDPVVVL